MMVCHCAVVSDREIRAQVVAGALDADDIARRCGAASRCGGCRVLVEALVAEHPRVGAAMVEAPVAIGSAA